MTRPISRITLLVLCSIFSVGSLALFTDALAAQWLAPAASDHITAEWVKQIEADLGRKPFKNVFMGTPGDPPIPALLHLLNNAARALADNKKDYAKLFINDALRILDNGVSKGWYSPTDIQPVKDMITKRAEAALEGKTTTAPTSPRWTGYSENKPLGLTNTLGDKQHASTFEGTTSAKDTTHNPSH
jgi:hypothetical protein